MLLSPCLHISMMHNVKQPRKLERLQDLMSCVSSTSQQLRHSHMDLIRATTSRQSWYSTLVAAPSTFHFLKWVKASLKLRQLMEITTSVEMIGIKHSLITWLQHSKRQMELISLRTRWRCSAFAKLQRRRRLNFHLLLKHPSTFLTSL